MSSDRDRFEQLTTAIAERRAWKSEDHGLCLDLDEGRRQVVHLEHFEFDGREMVRLYSLIGSTRRIKPEKLVYALEMNFKMPYGSMAVHDGTLVVVDTLMVADADESEIESAIAYIAETADRYEASMFGPDAY